MAFWELTINKKNTNDMNQQPLSLGKERTPTNSDEAIDNFDDFGVIDLNTSDESDVDRLTHEEHETHSTGQEESDGDDSVKDPTCYDRSDSSIKQTESGTPVLRRLTNNSIGVKSVNSEHRIGTRNDLMNVLAEKKRNDEATNTFLAVKRCCRETKKLIAYCALEFCTRKQSYGTCDLDISHHLVASSQALIGLHDESQQNGVPFHYFASETTAIEYDNYFSVINKSSAEYDELLRITDGVDLDRAYQKSMEQEKDASRNSCQSTVGVGSQNLTLRDKDGVTRPRAKTMWTRNGSA